MAPGRTTDNNMALNRLEEVQLRQGLKQLIISQAQIHYGPKHPAGSSFDVVIQEEYGSSGTLNAFLVVYPEPKDFSKWKCLDTNAWECYSAIEAMESLLDELEEAGRPGRYRLLPGTTVHGDHQV